jgi:hypothetical protein
MFIKRPTLLNSYSEVTKLIKTINDKKIGLILNGDDWEYPFMALMSGTEHHISHVDVNNISNTIKSKNENHNLILEVNSSSKITIVINHREFKRIWSDNQLSLYQLIED